MANLHLVTGYAGKSHVTAADDGSLNAAIFGTGQFVLNTGKKLAASVVSNNLIRIADGAILMQGRHIRLNEGLTVDLAIENGAQDMLRNDLIVARYTKDSVSGVEEVNLVVIKGTAVNSDPEDPAYTSGDIINDGVILNDMPLYRVPLTGLNIGTLEQLFEVVNENIQDLNSSKQVKTNNLTTGSSLADGDYFPFYDASATSHKKVLWSVIKSTLGKVFAPLSHNHSASEINSGTISSERLPTTPITKGGTGATTAAGALTNFGLTATVKELNYTDGVTSNIQTQLNGKAASSHNHSASEINSGTLSSERLPTVPIAKGGTGATTAAGARSNIGAAATEHEHSASDITDGILPIARGGTGATTAAGALAKLGLSATATELNYTDGVTSNIQTQLNGKAPSSHGHFYIYNTWPDGDILEWALSLGEYAGVHSFCTGGDSTNIPSGYTYSSGLVFVRSATFITVVLIKYNTGVMATNVYTSGAWKGWNKAIHETGGTLTSWLYFKETVDEIDYWSTFGTSPNNGSVYIGHNTGDTEDNYIILSGSDSKVKVPWGIASGGTGGATAAAARTNLGAAAKWTKLWENSSPASVFAAQTLTISGLSSCNLFKIGFMLSSENQFLSEVEVYVPKTTKTSVALNAGCLQDTLYVINRSRTAYITRSANTVQFSTGNYGYGNSAGSNNTGTIIPAYILGTTI